MSTWWAGINEMALMARGLLCWSEGGTRCALIGQGMAENCDLGKAGEISSLADCCVMRD